MGDKAINVLILGAGAAAGQGTDGFPAFMAEVKGAPLIQRLVESCSKLDPSWIGIACQSSDIDTYRLGELPKLLHPRAQFVMTKGPTQGAVCSALLAAEHIDNDAELLILGVTEYVDVNFLDTIQKFRDRQLDGGVLTFNSIHPRYSYVRTGQDGLVTQAAEKRPISNTAAATFFWYRRGADFIAAGKDVIRKHDHVNGFYYVAPTINQLLLRQRRIGIETVESSRYYPLKTTRQLDNFETAQEMRR